MDLLDKLPDVPSEAPGAQPDEASSSEQTPPEKESEDTQAQPDLPVQEAASDSSEKPKVKYYLRDVNKKMFEAFHEFLHEFEDIEVSHGDIFRDAPAADAIVSPANSFGFMDGGIDMAYSRHFGWQLSRRLQHIISTEYHGELLVGQAIVMPTYEDGKAPTDKDMTDYNQGQPIHYLISAPTMRVPLDVCETVNAYLAFRAVVLAVAAHNDSLGPEQRPIRSVLCPGLGTAVGCMPKRRCALQVRRAYCTHVLGLHPEDLRPLRLDQPYILHEQLALDVKDDPVPPPPAAHEVSCEK